MNQRAESYFMSNQKNFPATKLYVVEEKLNSMTDDQLQRLMYLQPKEPMVYLLISVFIGALGVDRFLIGDIGMGVLKLLTGGLFGILWIYDIVTIQDKVKDLNFEDFMRIA